MIISWFEKRVRRNVENLLTVVHREEEKTPAKKTGLKLRDLTYLPLDVQARLNELQDWRKSLARVRGIPPYRIFNNHTLLSLAMKNPATLEELSLINGIKEKRVSDFGEDLLQVLRKPQLH